MVGPHSDFRIDQHGGIYLTLVLTLAVCIVVAGIALIVYQEHFARRVYPGVYVEELDLRGKTRSEARSLLEQYYGDYVHRPIVLTGPKQSWMASLADMGVYVDIGPTVESAYSVGRSGEFVADMGTQMGLLLKGRCLAPVFDYDEGRSTVYLGRLARDIDQPARSASLIITGLQVRVESSRPGRELDVPATCRRLREQLAAHSISQLDLAVSEVYPPVIDVETGHAQAEHILRAPITLSFTDQVPDSKGGMTLESSTRTWTLDRAALADMLVIRQIAAPSGGVDLSIGLDRNQLTDWVEQIAIQVDRPPRNARFRFDPATGELTPTVMSQRGLQVDVAGTVELIESQIEAGEREASLHIDSTPASVSVDGREGLGIRELVSRGETSFQGSSAARARNIETAAARFDGVMVLPEETLSFNSYLGIVSEAHGFEESWVIFGDRTVLGPGGGVCQVSTTCFRAAFFGGFPVVERWPHAYRVGWYEPPLGLDAAIFSPSVDFKFTNDTGHGILIQTHADSAAGTLVFEFYGTKTGRVVEMEEPVVSDTVPPPDPVRELDPSLAPGTEKLVERSRDGLDVTVYRIVRWPDGRVEREEFFSRFQPWPARYKVGPAVEEQPAPEGTAPMRGP